MRLHRCNCGGNIGGKVVVNRGKFVRIFNEFIDCVFKFVGLGFNFFGDNLCNDGCVTVWVDNALQKWIDDLSFIIGIYVAVDVKGEHPNKT